MAGVQMAGPLRWPVPGPGTWTIDAVHFPRPVTRYWAEMHPAPFERGFAESDALLRAAVRHARVRVPRRLRLQHDGPRCPRSEIPARFQRAEEVFERKLWREQLREWDETAKPAAIRKHRELQSVDPDALSDAELVDYLTRCRDHHAEMIYQHMRFTAAPSVPTGDFLAHVGDWTGLPRVRAARPAARRRARLGGRVRRARAAAGRGRG